MICYWMKILDERRLGRDGKVIGATAEVTLIAFLQNCKGREHNKHLGAYSALKERIGVHDFSNFHISNVWNQ